MLLVFFGNIGTGKTSVARAVAADLDYEFVCFDDLVWNVTGKDKVYGPHDEFLLSFEETLKVYAEMHRQARDLLADGLSVVLESMYFLQQRNEAIALAQAQGKPWNLVEVVCDEKEVKTRLETRKAEDPQTPGYRLYLQFKDQMEKERRDHIILDTTGKTIEESVSVLCGKLRT